MYSAVTSSLSRSFVGSLFLASCGVKPAPAHPKSFWDRRSVTRVGGWLIHIDQILGTCWAKIGQLLSRQTARFHERSFSYEGEEILRAQRKFAASGEKLTGGPLLTYLEMIAPDTCYIIPEFFVADSAPGLTVLLKERIQEAIEIGKKQISIPIVDRGHIVHLLIEIDHEGKRAQIDFFDSFGFSARNYQRTEWRVDRWVEEVVHLLEEKAFNIDRVENHRVVQQDKHSCGLFVAEHFRLRVLEGIPAEGVVAAFSHLEIAQQRKKIAEQVAQRI